MYSGLVCTAPREIFGLANPTFVFNMVLLADSISLLYPPEPLEKLLHIAICDLTMKSAGRPTDIDTEPEFYGIPFEGFFLDNHREY